MQFHCWSFLDKIFECRKIVQLFSSADTIQKSVLLKHNYRLHKKLMKLYSNCQICIWKYYIYNYIYFHYYIYYHYLYFKNSTYLITNEKFSIIIISMTKKQRHHFYFLYIIIYTGFYFMTQMIQIPWGMKHFHGHYTFLLWGAKRRKFKFKKWNKITRKGWEVTTNIWTKQEDRKIHNHGLKKFGI